MKVTRQLIADVSMVSKAKVDKDTERGTLDMGSLSSISVYVVMNRMRSGGMNAISGKCPEGRGEEAETTEPVVYKPTVIEDMIGAGMITRGVVTPSYDDGQSDEVYVNPND